MHLLTTIYDRVKDLDFRSLFASLLVMTMAGCIQEPLAVTEDEVLLDDEVIAEDEVVTEEEPSTCFSGNEGFGILTISHLLNPRGLT